MSIRRRKRKYVILSRPAVRRGNSYPAHASLPAPPKSPDEIAMERYARSRRELIAEAAYLRAERRGFRGGDPVEDWLAAEAQVDAMLQPEPDRS